MKIIAFDIFGTVVDFSGVPLEEKRDYARQVRSKQWYPLQLPTWWETLGAFDDAAEGIDRLRHKFTVVTCSNAPIPLQIKLTKSNGLTFDWMVPLEESRVYKPNNKAYWAICRTLGVQPDEVMMVTANKDFGDIEGSQAIGMVGQLIRNPGCPQTIIELAEQLGC